MNIIQEYKRLKSLFSLVDESKTELVDNLIYQAAFMKVELDKLHEKDSDAIPVTLADDLMESVLGYLTEGSTIGVKASLNIDNNILRIVGDKVTFINTKK